MEQIFIAFVFGVAFVCVLIVLAAKFPHPTPFQYNVFRITLSLAAAGVGAMIPGFIIVDLNPTTGILIRAGGALAVFVIVFFFNPVQLAGRGEQRANAPSRKDENGGAKLSFPTPAILAGGPRSRFVHSGHDLEKVLEMRRAFFGRDLVSSDKSYRKCWARNPNSFKIVFDEDQGGVGYWGAIPVQEATYYRFIECKVSHERILSSEALHWHSVDPSGVYIYIIGAVVPIIGSSSSLGAKLSASYVVLDMMDFFVAVKGLYSVKGICGYPSRRYGHDILIRMGFTENGHYIDGDEGQPVCLVAHDRMGAFLSNSQSFVARHEKYRPMWDPVDRDAFVQGIKDSELIK